MERLVICALLLLLTGCAESTKCYVCGEQSLLADTCVDDYQAKESDMKDCKTVLGHTEGCIKSKYVDRDSRQIVSRSCAPEVGMKASNECKSTQVDGVHVFFCHCTGDYCNTSTKLMGSRRLILFTITLAAVASIY